MRPSFLTILATAAAAAVLTAAPAAAQTATPVPVAPCVDCFRNHTTGLFECKGNSTGAFGCALSDGGRSCSLSGGVCPKPVNPQPIDGSVTLPSAARTVPASQAGSLARLVSDEGGRDQLRAQCNGLVLARSYTPEAAGELKRRSAAITL
jgi:hypothetical protein